MIRKLVIGGTLFFIFCLLAGLGVGLWGYYYFSRDLPKFAGYDMYQPDAASLILADDGTILAEEYLERRYPFKIEEVPKHVVDAFLAAEDIDFYKHPGIDLVSILRAFIKNIKEGAVRQGGSTITQQVVKNLLLTNEKKLARKIKEAILAFRIENKLTKDQIIELYLNQIFFGNTAYGIKAASEIYFHKHLQDLTIAEGALLAGLPKAPSRYSPISNIKLAKQRQKYVLGQMSKHRLVSQQEADEAYNEKISVFKAHRNKYRQSEYYASEVIKRFNEEWPDYDLSRDGLKIYTAVDLKAQSLAKKALRSGLRAVDKRRGWRGPIKKYELGNARAKFIKDYRAKISKDLELDKLYPALVTSIGKKEISVFLGFYQTSISLSKISWAKRLLNEKDRVRWIKFSKHLQPGDVIEVSIKEPLDLEKAKPNKDGIVDIKKDTLRLDQTPEVQGAVTLINPHNGIVLSAVGGYDFNHSQFNRVTQSLRQPGSAFKPIVYLTAIDAFKYNASTIVYDEERSFRAGSKIWTPKNFDKRFMGPIPLRVALEKSRNLVSADIISRIGVDPVIRYAKQMGIESPLGRNLSLSLGSSEVTPLEISRAYGVFPAGGHFFPSIFIKKIEDRFGKVIYNYQEEVLGKSREVISEQTAFIMAHLMRGVVESGTGWRARELKRPAAGKTGTSNDQMDAWFVGYTPEYVCGVWVGFDQKKEIGRKETGGNAAAPIWVELMKNYLDYRDGAQHKELMAAAKLESEELGIKYKPPVKISAAKFSPPSGLKSYWIDKRSGTRSSKGVEGTILEYYLPGSGPAEQIEEAELDYWGSDEF